MARQVYRTDIGAAELREWLTYDPQNGVFEWVASPVRTRRWNMVYAGKLAGGKTGLGYWHIYIRHVRYLAHRLAWLYMTGAWPEGMLDHVNGDGLDNRWANLRAATRAQNAINTGLRGNNSSGHTGVFFDPRRGTWCARVARTHIGTFGTKSEAIAARQQAVVTLHGQFAKVT